MAEKKRQTPENALEFTLRLANAPITADMSEKKIVDAIYAQIKQAQSQGYFPQYFHTIDPDNSCSETRVLGDPAKQRLRDAVAKYVNEMEAR